MTPIELYNAYTTIARKEVGRCLRIWLQVFVPPVITMMLYYCIFGKVVGKHVPSIHGFTYIQFISPGLIMMSVLMSAYINTSSSFFSAKFSRSIEEMLVSPMPNWIVILGYITGSVFRSVVVGVFVVLTSLIFTHLDIHHWFIMAYTLLSTSILFSLIGLLNGVFARKFDDVSWVPSFVITPLTYLAGVFYSISLLPPVWRFISKLNPIHYIISSFRYGMLGIGGGDIVLALISLTLFNAVFFIINLYYLKHSTGLRS
jgi:ABC-2 type transport system permease protein